MSEPLNLEGEDWEQQLQQALRELPQEDAPRALQRKLTRIPGRESWWPALPWLKPALGIAVVLVPVVALLVAQDQRLAEQERQIAQGRRDLAIALDYIDRVNRRAAVEVMATLDGGLKQPVTDTTVEVVRRPLQLTRKNTQEYDL